MYGSITGIFDICKIFAAVTGSGMGLVVDFCRFGAILDILRRDQQGDLFIKPYWLKTVIEP